MGLLSGKTAVITGSSKGIGRGIALRFAAEGARVVVNGRDPNAVGSAVREIGAAGGDCVGIAADVSDEDDVVRLFDEVARVFGPADVLVNNASVPLDARATGPFLAIKGADWDEYVGLSLAMLFRPTMRAARDMAAAAIRGSIVNIGSNGSVRAHRRLIAYDTVKGAMDAFTRAIAVDLAPWGIRVNVIRPGYIAVGTQPPLSADQRAFRAAAIPLGRLGTPADVAWAAVFLAADDAGYTTGQAFEVDGGLLAQGRSPQAESQPVATPATLTGPWRGEQK